MTMASLDPIAVRVRQRYPAALDSGALEPLGNRGGFSGARLWRWQTLGGMFALRAWPAEMTAARLTTIHRLMREARRASLSFVPTLLPTREGTTWIEEEGRLWE